MGSCSSVRTSCDVKSPLDKFRLCRRGNEVAEKLAASDRVNDADDMSVIPLTEREILMLMQSWKHIQRNIVETGMRMFLSMLQNSASAKLAFEKFRTINNGSALWKSSVLQTHGLVVMSALDEIISNLDDHQTVIDLIREQGRSHVRFGDLSGALLWAIRDPFLDAVKESLDQHYTLALQDLYTRAIDFILRLLVDGFETKRRQRAAM